MATINNTTINIGSNITVISTSPSANKAAKVIAQAIQDNGSNLDKIVESTKKAGKATGVKRPNALFAQSYEAYKDAKAHLESNEAMHEAFNQVNKVYTKGLIPTNVAGNTLFKFSCGLGLALSEANSDERVSTNYKPCLVIKDSTNRKLGGGMITTYQPECTCPDKCPLKQSGACYAKNGKTNLIRQRIEAPKADDKSVSTSLEQTLTKFTVAALYQTQHKDEGEPVIFRFSTAGDFAKANTSTLDVKALDNMSWAANKAHELASIINPGHGFIAYTYTHCEQSYNTDNAIRGVHEKYGVTVNYSANTLHEVESAYRANMPVVYAADDVDHAKCRLTAKGIKSVVCPNQTRGLTCAQCKLCAKFDRNAVILFKMHGAKAKLGEQVIAKLNNLAD